MSDFRKFIDAIKQGNQSDTKRFFKSDFLNQKYEGWAPLHYASQYNLGGSITEFLIQEGCDIEIECDYGSRGWRSLHIAAKYGNYVVMSILISIGADLDCLDCKGNTPLDVAYQSNMVDCVKLLREKTTKQIQKINPKPFVSQTLQTWTISTRIQQSDSLFFTQADGLPTNQIPEDTSPSTSTSSGHFDIEEPFPAIPDEDTDDQNITIQNIIESDLVLQISNKSSIKMEDFQIGTTVINILQSYNDPIMINRIISVPVNDEELNSWKLMSSSGFDKRNYELIQECLLYRCIRHKNIEGFQLLCTVDIVNKDSLFMGPSVLECTVDSGVTMLVQHVLKKLINVDDSWIQAENLANKNERYDLSRLIWRRRRYLRRRKEKGYSRMHVAVYDNDPEFIEYLLKNEDIDQSFGEKTVGSPLSLAYELDYMDCAEILQNYEVNVNVLDGLRQSTLQVAISSRVEDHFNYLVDNTENIDAENLMGQTAFVSSVMNNCENICQSLLRKGAKCDRFINVFARVPDFGRDLSSILPIKPHIPITNQETIQTLCFKVNKTIYRCLLDNIDQDTIDLTDEDGNTLLHLVAASLNPDLCQQLIQRFANVNAKNSSNSTPLMNALMLRNIENIKKQLIDTVNVLVDNGALLNIEDTTGRNPFTLATDFHDEELLLPLIRRREPLECIHTKYLTDWMNSKYFTMIRGVIPLVDRTIRLSWITEDCIKRYANVADISLTKFMYENTTKVVQVAVLETFLFRAVKIGDKDLFKEMIPNEISRESIVEDGESLLCYLIKQKSVDLIEIVLYSRNAFFFMQKKNSSNQLPIHICIECDCWHIIDKLIVGTKCVNDEDDQGNTPLSLLITKVSETVDQEMFLKLMTYIKMLMNVSADIYKPNKLNLTPLMHCSKKHVEEEIVSFYEDIQQTEPKEEYRPRPQDAINSLQNHVTLSTPPRIFLCSRCNQAVPNTALNCGHLLCLSCATNVENCDECGALITLRLAIHIPH